MADRVPVHPQEERLYRVNADGQVVLVRCESCEVAEARLAATREALERVVNASGDDGDMGAALVRAIDVLSDRDTNEGDT